MFYPPCARMGDDLHVICQRVVSFRGYPVCSDPLVDRCSPVPAEDGLRMNSKRHMSAKAMLICEMEGILRRKVIR